jgi:hypothetical protein
MTSVPIRTIDIDKTLVRSHRTNHINIFSAAIIVESVFDNFNPDQIFVLQHGTHALAKIVEDVSNFIGRDAGVHLVSTYFANITRVLVDKIAGLVVLMDIAGKVHVRGQRY